MDLHTTGQWAISLATLSLLEIVLGIDNIVIISILSEKLPKHQKSKARKTGLSLALITRVLLLTTLTWLSSLTTPLFSVLDLDISVRDLVLMSGGVFLLIKATSEICSYVRATDVIEGKKSIKNKASNFVTVVISIIFFDIVFSFDSVLTAVGLARQLWIMILAVIIAVVFMLIFVDQVSDFIEKNPTIKLLALAFLILVGILLIAESLHHHLDHNVVYFVMAFSITLEFLTMQRKRRIHQFHSSGS